ncbi:hypothetical protein L208DRAFT_1279265, partial [Tricholoma matsutake]
FWDKPTSDLDSARQNTSKNLSPKFFPRHFRVAKFFEQDFARSCTPFEGFVEFKVRLCKSNGERFGHVVAMTIFCLCACSIHTTL